jgi:hypothetical protein
MTKNTNSSSPSILSNLQKRNKKHQKNKLKKRNRRLKRLLKAVPTKYIQSQGYVPITAKVSRIAYTLLFQSTDFSTPNNSRCSNHTILNHTKSLPSKSPKCQPAKNFNKTRTSIRFMIYKVSVIVTSCR